MLFRPSVTWKGARHLQKTYLFIMSRRSLSAEPSTSRTVKRPRLEFSPLTPEDYKDGVMFAPMVRSGALPTRLFALKHGASLVWGPEVVDKAILHAERVVDTATGIISYNGKSKAIFCTHPIEKPYLIYQIGSADPEIAVQAAKTVMQDVSGIDLNCGCPKPFSTHAGMGAALLSNPDLLCNILTSLRAALPPEISISCKIRLLPTQEETLKLVERIVNTGVNCLTIHCRTRYMRPRERALIERLREIVEFAESLGKGTAVIENGDCLSWEDAKRIRNITGAHSAMIATAAEANPTCFSPKPLIDLEQTLVPAYIRLCKYIDHNFALTKFCASSFQGQHVNCSNTEKRALRESIRLARSYDDLEPIVGPWNGEEEFAEIVKSLGKRRGRRPQFESELETLSQQALIEATPSDSSSQIDSEEAQEQQEVFRTPPAFVGPPDESVLRAPLMPANELRMPIPAFITGVDVETPTPTPPSSQTFIEVLTT